MAAKKNSKTTTFETPVYDADNNILGVLKISASNLKVTFSPASDSADFDGDFPTPIG